MAGPLWDHVGGIQGLLDLSSDLWEAIEADLLTKGFTLADVPERVTWRALHAMVRRSQHGSAVFQEMYGPAAQWGALEHIDASIIDVLNTIAWLLSDTKRNKRPKPIPRPGQKKEGMVFGASEVTLSGAEFEAEWDRRVAVMIEAAESAANNE